MSTVPDPRRGEIWRADLEPTRGDEIRKARPVVVISEDSIGRLRLRIVVPITDWDDRFPQYPWMVRLDPDSENGLIKPSAADTFQVRSISVNRLRQKLGTLPHTILDALAEGIAL
jgi:mRNA interferase MazF